MQNDCSSAAAVRSIGFGAWSVFFSEIRTGDGPFSLPQQAATAVVQQVSPVVIKQVASPVTLNSPCRTRKRWPPHNQLRGSRRTALTV